VGFLGAGVLFQVLLPAQRAFSLTTLAVEIAAYALASRVEFEVGSGVVVPTEIVFASMLFVLPCNLVALAVGAGMLVSRLPELVHARESLDSAAATVGSGWFSIGPVLLLAALHAPAASSSRWPLLFLLVAVQAATDFVTTATREWWALGIRPRQLLGAMSLAVMIDAVLAPIGFLAAISDSTVSLLMPLLLLSLIVRFARERKHAIDGAMELGRAYRGTAYLLGDMIEADDAYTGAHSRDVVELSLAVGDRLGLGSRERQAVELVALLHDVGKIKVPNEIIRKQGPLTPDERALIETHTVEGEQLLLKVGGLLGEVGAIVRSCHERWDGRGYPDRLAGEAIPLVARIICCCDAFNAMTTERSYRKGRPVAEAADELRRCAGSHFDPAVVEALLSVVGFSRPDE
jgi:HD-GYP domain-containing protein (c-di-GMP phosphodiesterase class II)